MLITSGIVFDVVGAAIPAADPRPLAIRRSCLAGRHLRLFRRG